MIKTIVFIFSSFSLLASTYALDDGTDKILYIGDSHSVNETMRTELQSNLGPSVAYYASCGSHSIHWAKGGFKSRCGNYNAPSTPSMERLLIKEKPKKLIIELGDNHFEWIGNNPRRAVGIPANAGKYMNALLAKVDDSTPCYWVGPTWGSRGGSYFKSDAMVDEMYATIKKAVGHRCEIVDCRNAVSRNSTGDGLHHHNKEASKAWAGCIAEKTKTTTATGGDASTTIEN